MSRIPKLDVVGILQEHGAILEGHYRLPSGLHTSKFVQPERVLQFPNLAQKLAKSLSAQFPGWGAWSSDSRSLTHESAVRFSLRGSAV